MDLRAANSVPLLSHTRSRPHPATELFAGGDTDLPVSRGIGAITGSSAGTFVADPCCERTVRSGERGETIATGCCSITFHVPGHARGRVGAVGISALSGVSRVAVCPTGEQSPDQRQTEGRLGLRGWVLRRKSG